MRTEYGGVLTKIFKLLQGIEKNTSDISKELKKMNREKPVVNITNNDDNLESIRSAVEDARVKSGIQSAINNRN